jgi:nitrate/nitrite-specific signal transduction histidine kinase
MRERADTLGGRVAIERIAGGGTRVRLALPVAAPSDATAGGACR